jgi:hypothetical protein
MRSDRIDHRAWFTTANSLPMPIGIGLGAIPDLAAAHLIDFAPYGKCKADRAI